MATCMATHSRNVRFEVQDYYDDVARYLGVFHRRHLE